MPLVGIGTLPTPFSPASAPLPPETGGRGHTSLRVGGWGESQFRRGAYTVVLFICTYFVPWSQQVGGLHAFLYKAAQNFEVFSNIQNQKLKDL